MPPERSRRGRLGAKAGDISLTRNIRIGKAAG
jgi:hypothetical protein